MHFFGFAKMYRVSSSGLDLQEHPALYFVESFSRSPTKPQIENSFIASELKAAIYTESREYLFAPMSESAGRIIHLKSSCSKASLASFFSGLTEITMYSTFFYNSKTPVN